MSESVKVKVLRIRRGAGAIAKTGSYPNVYSLPVIYELEDGREIGAHVMRRLLREAKEEEAKLPEEPDHEVRAMFRDGEFIGTSHSFRIGGRR